MVPRLLEICTGRCARPQTLQQGAFEFRSGRVAAVFNFAQTRLPLSRVRYARAGMGIAVSKGDRAERKGDHENSIRLPQTRRDCVRLAQTATEAHSRCYTVSG